MRTLASGLRLAAVWVCITGAVLAVLGLVDALFIGSGLAVGLSCLGSALASLGLALVLDTVA